MIRNLVRPFPVSVALNTDLKTGLMPSWTVDNKMIPRLDEVLAENKR